MLSPTVLELTEPVGAGRELDGRSGELVVRCTPLCGVLRGDAIVSEVSPETLKNGHARRGPGSHREVRIRREDLRLTDVEPQPSPRPLRRDGVVSVRKVVDVRLQLRVVSEQKQLGRRVLSPHGLKGSLCRPCRRDAIGRTRQGATLVQAVARRELHDLPVRRPPPVSGWLAAGVPDGQRPLQHRTEVTNLLHHPGAIQRLVSGTNVQAHDGFLRVKFNQSSGGVIGLNTAVLRSNPILMDPRRSHGLNLGRLGDRAQAKAAVNTVHDEWPHTGIRLLNGQDFANGVRPNHCPRLLPEGEADNEGRHALHTVLRVLQVLQVFDPSGHRPGLGVSVRCPDRLGD